MNPTQGGDGVLLGEVEVGPPDQNFREGDPNTLQSVILFLLHRHRKPIHTEKMDMPPSKGTVPAQLEPRPISLFNESNPQSLCNMVGPSVKEKLDEHQFEHPELFTQDERELMNRIRGMKGQKPHGIGPTENRIRVAFWLEYDRAITSPEPKINYGRVYSGVCSQEYFYMEIIRRPEKLAWMLCPPASYSIAMEEALQFGIEKLRDLLDLPLYKKNGEPDTKVGELILKAVQMIDIRQKGAIIQRVQTMNLHKHEHQKTQASQPPESMAELDQRLNQLEQKSKASGLPAIEIIPSRLRPEGQ